MRSVSSIQRFVLGFIFLSSVPGLALAAASADKDKVEMPRTFDASKVFSIETDADSVSESLNRIAGDYDRGYAPKENTYKSEKHAGTGAFQRSEAIEKNQSSGGAY